jgi:hypothetical protein
MNNSIRHDRTEKSRDVRTSQQVYADALMDLASSPPAAPQYPDRSTEES